MVDKVPMTAAGYQQLQDELKNLKNVERPNIIEAIAEARALGDLKENAEYHSAREKQGFIEGRIKELESAISRADVIDPATYSDKTLVKFGAKVTVFDEGTEEESSYVIVGDYEADIAKKLLSTSSPIAQALINKEVGDVVKVTSPGGIKSYEIVEITY